MPWGTGAQFTGAAAPAVSGSLIQPSGDTSGVTDAAAVNSAFTTLGAGGGSVYLAPGHFYFAVGTVTLTGLYQYLIGSGRWATTIFAIGSGGDTIRVFHSDTTGQLTGGGLADFTLDGSMAGAATVGLHYGDMRAGELGIGVQNFTGAGSMGVHFDNQHAWTEECHGYLWVSNCTQCIVFDVSGAVTSTNSYGYSDFFFEILEKGNQDALVLQNGAFLYHSRVSVKANFAGTVAANTAAAIRITGVIPAGHPGAGTGSAIANSRFDFMAECTSATGPNAPQTINFGNLSLNSLTGCTGILDFTFGSLAFAVSNFTALSAAGAFQYLGFVAGDAHLNQAVAGLGQGVQFAVSAPLIYSPSLLEQGTGNMLIDVGDFFQQTLSVNITVNLVAGGSAYNAAQRKTVLIRQASVGGPFTVTWPHNGAPTTAAPTVNWAGGTAPTMSAGAGALDVYELVTYDGATWIGKATQNVS
jgi:hypothetical protein